MLDIALGYWINNIVSPLSSVTTVGDNEIFIYIGMYVCIYLTNKRQWKKRGEEGI
jgi:hypothetical protein